MEYSSYTFKVCICGHGEHEHDTNFRRVPFSRTRCNNCNCNVYEQIGIFTYDQWLDYKKEKQVRE